MITMGYGGGVNSYKGRMKYRFASKFFLRPIFLKKSEKGFKNGKKIIFISKNIRKSGEVDNGEKQITGKCKTNTGHLP